MATNLDTLPLIDVHIGTVTVNLKTEATNEIREVISAASYFTIQQNCFIVRSIVPHFIPEKFTSISVPENACIYFISLSIDHAKQEGVDYRSTNK